MHLYRLAAVMLISIVSTQVQVTAAIYPAASLADINEHFASYYGIRQHAEQRLVVTLESLGGVTRPVVQANLYGTDTAQHSDFYLLGEQHPVQSTRRWYAMSVFLPETWNDSNIPITIAQVDSSSSTSLPAPLALQVRGKQLMLNMNFNHRTGDLTKENSAHRNVLAGPATLGRWHCMVVRADWSAVAGNGELRVYMNGSDREAFFARYSHNSYANALHVPRVGLSAPIGADNIGHRMVYADFIWVGDSATTLNDMTQKTPCHQ